MAFEAKEYSINDVLRNNVFEIPRNQRRYVWEKENWQDLFDDILFSISSQNPHFIGSIVLEKKEEINGLSYVSIIDGQQRLITITLILIAIIRLFSEMKMEDDFYGTIPYLKTKDNRNKDKIILNANYHLSLEKIINDIIKQDNSTVSFTVFLKINTIAPKDKKITDAIAFFYNEIKKEIAKSKDPNEKLIKIRQALIDMTVVKIVSNSEEDSYTIFEILNARGLDLEPFELIKNYIMRYIYPDEKRDSAKEKWEEMENKIGTATNRFMSHYVIHSYDTKQMDKIQPYHIIQKNIKAKQSNNITNQVNDLLDDILLKSKYYLKLIDPKCEGDNANCSKKEYSIFSFFKKRRFELFRPILLSIIHHRELEEISDKDYQETITYLYNFFIGFTIIGEEKSNKLLDSVRKHAPLIENANATTVCDAIEAFIKELQTKLPEFPLFLNTFKTIGWSNHYEALSDSKKKQRVKTVLEVIEKYLSQNEDIIDFSIEHMYSDHESNDNANIGNLIPLEENINGKCKDKPLSEKYAMYQTSMYASARGVAKRYNGNHLDINSRAEHLAKIIYYNILKLDKSPVITRDDEKPKELTTSSI